VPPLQAPLPSHCEYALLPMQAAHTVPAGHVAQAPEPSHDPVVPHVEDAVDAHWSRGSVPAGRIVQVPSAVAPMAAVQARQTSLQAMSQQTPWAQKPLRQWVGAVHAVPFA
jgi:hypothetical protein